MVLIVDIGVVPRTLPGAPGTERRALADRAGDIPPPRRARRRYDFDRQLSLEGVMPLLATAAP